MVVSRIEDEKQFLLDNPKREMSKLEIYGAMYQLHLATDYEVDMETIDYNTFYFQKWAYFSFCALFSRSIFILKPLSFASKTPWILIFFSMMF